MIILRLRAGLGNQLFQYAMGRRLADEYDTSLVLDPMWYIRRHRGVPSRHPNIIQFSIRGTLSTDEDIRQILGAVPPRILHLTARIVEKTPGIPAERIVRRLAGSFDYYAELRSFDPSPDLSWPHSRRFCRRMLDAGPDAYLAGFWESYRYFDPIADQLREELNVATPLRGRDREIADTIDASGSSVGIHLRKGDIAGGGGITSDWYREAVTEMDDRLDCPRWFVFSNAPEWARQRVDFDGEVVYVDHNDGMTDYEDWRLLRRCDHQITANSTFSWWAAFMNRNPDKIVLVPWRRNERNQDFLPSDWESVII